MSHSIEVIRAALQRIHHVAIGQSDRAYMSIPADPQRDADLILSAAIDELLALRTAGTVPTEHAEEMAREAAGAITHALAEIEEAKRGLVLVVAERDELRSTAARLVLERDAVQAREVKLRELMYGVLGQQHVLKHTLSFVGRWGDDTVFVDPELRKLAVARSTEAIEEWHRRMVAALTESST